MAEEFDWNQFEAVTPTQETPPANGFDWNQFQAVTPVDPELAARRAIIQSYQRPTPARVLDLATAGPNLVTGVAKSLGDILSGAAKERVGGLQEFITQTAQGSPVEAISQLGRNELQTGIEGATLAGYDLLDLARRGINQVPALVGSVTRQVARDPALAINPMGLAQAVGVESLTPRTPSESEIQNQLSQQRENQAFQTVRAAGVSPVDVGGKVSPKTAELVGLLADPELGLGLAGTKVGVLGARAAAQPLTREALVTNALKPGGTLSTAFRGTARDFLTFIKNPTTDAEKAAIREAADNGTLLKPVQEVAAIGTPNDVYEAIQFTTQAKNARSTQLDSFVQGPAGDAPLNVERILQAELDAINSNPKLNVRGSEALKERLISKAQADYSKPWTARDLFQRQKDINALHKSILDKEKTSRKSMLDSSPERAMEDAARRETSKLLDEYQQGVSGVADNPFRAYGQLAELEGDLSSIRDAAETTRSEIAAGSKGPLKATAEGGIGAGVAASVRRITPDDLSLLNENVKLLFKRLPTSPPPATLDATVKQSLLARSLQQPPILPTDAQLQAVIERGFQERLAAEGASPEDLNAYLTQEANRARTIAAAEGVRSEIPGILAPELQAATQAAERQALSATPEEISTYLAQEANLARSERAVQEATAKAIESVAATEKRLARDIIRSPATTLLEDFYHLRNKGMDTTRVEEELTRRLTLKKDSKAWNDIREALGIPLPVEVPNAPRTRELNLEEAIRSVSPQ